MKNILFCLLLAFIFVVTFSFKAYAEDVNWIDGPKSVPIADGKVVIFISQDFVFADKENAIKYLKKNHVTTNKSIIGLVMSSNIDDEWFVVLEYKDVGYFKEEWLVNMDAEGFMKGLQRSQEQSKYQNFNPMVTAVEIAGYYEKPSYDDSTKRLTTAIKAKQGKIDLVNYLIMIFGCEGVINARLVCKEDEFPELRKYADKIIGNIKFNRGYTYAEFDPKKHEEAFSTGSDILSYLTTGKLKSKNKNVPKPSAKSNKPGSKKGDLIGGGIATCLMPIGIVGIIILVLLARKFME